MQDRNELEQYFLNDIKRQSDAEIEDLKQEQEAIAAKAVAEIHAEIEKEAITLLDQELKEMASEYTVKNSKINEERNRRLMLKREEMTSQIFTEVMERLHNFVTSQAYISYFQKLLNDYTNHHHAVFYIGKIDESKKTILFKDYPNVQIKIDPHIEIGGFRMENEKAGIVADETFDTRLDNEKKWFYANSSLSIRS